MYYLTKKSKKATPPHFITVFSSGWIIILMLMAVLLVFTSCEQQDLALDNPEKLETRPDLSSMTEAELIDYFKNLDRKTLKSNFSDHWIDKSNAQITAEDNPRISLRASCQAEISIYKTGGTSTEYDVIILEEGNPIPLLRSLSGDPYEEESFPIDDTKYYDFFIYSDGGTAEYFDFKVITPDNVGYVYNFHGDSYEGVDMTDDDPEKVLEFDYFDCN